MCKSTVSIKLLKYIYCCHFKKHELIDLWNILLLVSNDHGVSIVHCNLISKYLMNLCAEDLIGARTSSEARKNVSFDVVLLN